MTDGYWSRRYHSDQKFKNAVRRGYLNELADALWAELSNQYRKGYEDGLNKLYAEGKLEPPMRAKR